MLVFISWSVWISRIRIPEGNEIRNCHINIGTGKEVTIAGLAQIIVEIVGYKGKISFDSFKPDGTMRKLTNPSKLHELADGIIRST